MFSGLGAVLSGIGTLATIGVLLITLRLSNEQKKADIQLESHRRFDRLVECAHDLNKAFKLKAKADPNYIISEEDKSDGMHYFKRFFSLQFDMFNTFRTGYIDKDVFLYWMRSRSRGHTTNNSVCGVSYRDAWNYWTNNPDWLAHEFKDFLTEVHKSEADATEAVIEACPSWWRQRF